MSSYGDDAENYEDEEEPTGYPTYDGELAVI